LTMAGHDTAGTAGTKPGRRPDAPNGKPGTAGVHLYDDEGDGLLAADQFPDRVSLLPGTVSGAADTSPASAEQGPLAGERIRILWGQDMLRDVLDGRYRAVVCGVNDQDNAHGIITQLVELIRTSQWSPRSVTSYAKMFHEAVAVHAAGDREPYVLKYDLDSVLILALLRPRNRDHFTLDDLARGFETISRMLEGRRERQPAASVSFLAARSNRLLGPGGNPPSFETVLRTMYEAGFRGDVYPSPAMWRFGQVGVFPSYPFPAGLDRMREGSS
ncbi:MAG TPA: hypothetical protein VD963_05065, partial [Phycisphaerales bacterium]|nr:hypothetical protein [Phycisphaerales bacterium]